MPPESVRTSRASAQQLHEVEVAERLGEDQPRHGGEVLAVERLAGARMDREDDRQLALEPADRRQDAGEHVADRRRWPAGAASGRRTGGPRGAAHRGLVERRLSSRHASKVSIMTLPTRKMRSSGDSFAPQVLHPARLGHEQPVADRVGEDAVDLLGHGAVEAAQARLDVGHRDAQLDGRQAQAIVELTSPTTTTASGFCSSTTGSNRFITSAVWTAWLPEPTPRSTSGRGSRSSSKKSCDIRSS